MKKILLILLSMIGFLLVLILAVGITIFVKPEWIVTPETLDFALKKTHVLQSWSMKEMKFEHKWIKWNKRKFAGSFTDFCFVKENELKRIEGCLNNVRWNAEIGWTKGKGIEWTVHEPLSILSDKLIITTKAEDDSPPTDYFALWDQLWKMFIPDIRIHLKSVKLVDLTTKDKDKAKAKDNTKEFSLKLEKNAKEITAEAMDLTIKATKDRIVIIGPKPMKIPVDLKTKNPLYFRELNLVAEIRKDDVPLTLTGKIDTAKVQVTAAVKKEWVGRDLPEHKVIKNILLTTKGDITVEKLKQTMGKLMKPPFNQLPAPINAMEGSLVVSLRTEEKMQDEKQPRPEDVALLVRTNVDLEGAKQFLKFHVDTNMDFDTKVKKPGPFVVEIDFQKVVLKLPRLEKNKMPPQFKPDKRFYSAERLAKKEAEKKKKKKNKRSDDEQREDLSMQLQAEKEKPLQIKTNLVDEVLKMYFDLRFDEGELREGYVQTLPLRTEIFRRKVTVNSVRVNFHAPVEPDVVADIDFHLPEYQITLKLEGPLSKPRTAFSSQPPLPEDDIIAVLLFGRPLNDLDAEDKTATKETSQIISQGLLSLSVLYFFAGSPIQSIGYDPTTKEVSAQVGLGRKNSLRVSSEGKGVSGAGLRRSLGKGWYIDSTVQKSNTTSGTGNDYGVLLERIISY